MALSSKRSKRIVVDEAFYLWRVSKRGLQPDARLGRSFTVVTIAADQKPSCTLIVKALNSASNDGLGLTGDAILPSHIASFVRNAIQAGWTPLASGKPFEVIEDVGLVKPTHEVKL
jgi:hypothetical protein